MTSHRAVRDLSERHHGREVRIAGTPPIVGTLVGLIPCADTVTLALIVGGTRTWHPLPRGRFVDLGPRQETP